MRTLFRLSIPAIIIGAVIVVSFVGRKVRVGQSAVQRHFPMTSLACNYRPVAPVVTGVSPSSGPSTGGTTVTITGTAFDCVTSVTFGGVAATIISSTSTQIVVTSPAHAAGTVDVIVTTPGGTSAATPADHFTYNPSWQPCESHGGILSIGPVASTWGTNRLDAFVRGTDGHIWHRFYNNGTWTWEDLGGPLNSLPAAVSWGVGRIDLLARANDTALWWDSFTTAGGWSGWSS